MITYATAWLVTKGFYFAALGGPCPNPDRGSFFGLPRWWAYLNDSVFRDDGAGGCYIDVKFNDLGGTNVFTPIGLAVLDGLLRIAGVVAVAYVIVGGITYITSAGSPEQATSARKKIINALVGAAIAITSVAIVQFIGRRVSGG